MSDDCRCYRLEGFTKPQPRWLWRLGTLAYGLAPYLRVAEKRMRDEAARRGLEVVHTLSWIDYRDDGRVAVRAAAVVTDGGDDL